MKVSRTLFQKVFENELTTVSKIVDHMKLEKHQRGDRKLLCSDYRADCNSYWDGMIASTGT